MNTEYDQKYISHPLGAFVRLSSLHFTSAFLLPAYPSPVFLSLVRWKTNISQSVFFGFTAEHPVSPSGLIRNRGPDLYRRWICLFHPGFRSLRAQRRNHFRPPFQIDDPTAMSLSTMNLIGLPLIAADWFLTSGVVLSKWLSELMHHTVHPDINVSAVSLMCYTEGIWKGSTRLFWINAVRMFQRRGL